MKIDPRRSSLAVLAVALLLVRPAQGAMLGDKTSREEGEFRIFVGGKEIGTEKYSIDVTGESASSSSILNFRNPGGSRQKIHMETKLDMDARYMPRSYELRSDVDGKKGGLLGTFKPLEALFEYQSEGGRRRTGVLVGDRYTMLDTNVFHHFVFLARLFDFTGNEKNRKFEIVIPQEADSGFLNLVELKRETIVVRGKKTETHHLRADSGILQMQLWVDDQHILHKIAVRDKNIEVIRSP